MKNFINVYMDYKVNCLIRIGIFFLKKDNSFIKRVFRGYFYTYIDNYYYKIFNTIDGEKFTLKNLKQEFDGIMLEMLDDYKEYELIDDNHTYQENCNLIRKLNSFCYEIVRLDLLKYSSKGDIAREVEDFVHNNRVLSSYVTGSLSELISIVRENYTNYNKLLEFDDQYFNLDKKKFENDSNILFWELVPNIKVLDIYRDSLVKKVFQENKLLKLKMKCFIQKISIYLLKNVLNREDITPIIIKLDSNFISRGTINEDLLDLMDNPLFQKYVILGVDYSIYQNQRSAFLADYQFACIQDFTHINDVYQKTDSIYKEGIFNYLIVEDCKYRDRDYFLDYNSDVLKILLFEED